MSVDTNALLIGSPNQEEIAAALRLAFPEIEVKTEAAYDDETFRVFFADPICKPGPRDAKHRMMFVLPSYEGDECKNVFDGRGTWCSLGASGGSVQIMEALARHFGGFVRDKDDADWRHIAAEEGKEPNYTSEDRLRITLASVAGPKAGTAIANLINDPEKLTAVTQALVDYAAEISTPSATP